MSLSGRILLLAALAGVATMASAQTYRWTDPKTGRTVVSNLPPPAGVKSQRLSQGGGNADDSSDPPELRAAVARFPVVYYTNTLCDELCEDGRRLLRGRGIPYTEKSADLPEVVAELRTLTGAMPIPTLKIGREVFRGFDTGAWTNLLDLAGYPARPAPGYKPPPKPVAVAAEAAPAQ